MGWLAGVLILFFGLLASIALHELGHFSFAKLFGVRTTQFMVGFGPTMWSRRKGETEYGVKWIPLGGYIRMIGMLPPRRGDAPGQVRRISTGPWQGLIESARGAALEEVRPGDENRVFYNKKWWQKLLIMFGGPAMNLILAVVFFAILLMGIGMQQAQPVIAEVSPCMVPKSQASVDHCPAGATPTPAKQAGLQEGDRIVSYEGRAVEDYKQLQKQIRDSAGRTVPMVVDRGGRRLTLNVPITRNQMRDLDDQNKIVEVGFLGITPTTKVEREGPGAVASTIGDLTGHTVGALVRMPQKMVGIWNAAFSGDKRDPNGPIGVVGVSRIGGDVAASDQLTGGEKVSYFVMLLGSLNLAVGLFNLVPLLPLDGGHMAGALLEALKKGFARVFRRPDPGYVDVAKALPVTYVMAAVLIVMGGLLIYADLVNPVRFNG
ncbi:MULTISPECIES: RIP metalloprotease [Actinomadura]|uniref:PDZ domain-containing protein n=1 Tax=Actinomadura litoris TaxID=2678616 RepID=A0A7K1KXX0_9ACTN|nr:MULTISPECIES: site-2 protease family protein [Actinomadura]MBT2209132.1 site-2 protease family protein [Actinomadura sp. NEAU-AAG7]MUN37052.1 PDZ domain-containing protein [Actinomadura litoris]